MVFASPGSSHGRRTQRGKEEDGDIATTRMRAVYVEPPLPQLAGWQLVYFCCHSLPPRWIAKIASVSVYNVNVYRGVRLL